MEIILVILAIIGGISSLFKDKITEQPKKEQHQQPRPTTSVPDSSEKKQSDQSHYEPNADSIKIQEQRDEQMHQLARHMNIETEENEETNNVDFDEALKDRANQKEIPETDMQKWLRNNLNRKGLVNGIIMSEVLGPPRARKPYQNVITKRSQ